MCHLSGAGVLLGSWCDMGMGTPWCQGLVLVAVNHAP